MLRYYTKGDKLCEEGAQETSSVIVETVPKFAKGGQKTGPVLPNFKSDASKVTSKGMGLKKAFLGKQNQFTISATDAGKFKYSMYTICMYEGAILLM